MKLRYRKWLWHGYRRPKAIRISEIDYKSSFQKTECTILEYCTSTHCIDIIGTLWFCLSGCHSDNGSQVQTRWRAVWKRLWIYFHRKAFSANRTLDSGFHTASWAACCNWAHISLCGNDEIIKFCHACRDSLTSLARSIMEFNPTPYRFCTELVLVATYNAKMIAWNMQRLILYHVQSAKRYFREPVVKISEGSKAYSECYGRELQTGRRKHSAESRYFFPDREQYRPPIEFDVKERHHCSKKYPASNNFSPGILTEQWVCDTPKRTGFIVMTRAELTALEISALVSHFQVPEGIQPLFHSIALATCSHLLLRFPGYFISPGL